MPTISSEKSCSINDTPGDVNKVPYKLGRELSLVLEPLQLVQIWYKHRSQFESKGQEFHWVEMRGRITSRELTIVEKSSVAELWGRQG